MLKKLRRQIASAIMPIGDYNKYNAAFLSLVGQVPIHYDDKKHVYIEKGYNANPTVFAVVNQFAKKVADIPYSIKKVTNEKKAQSYKHFRTRTDLQGLIRKTQLSTKAFEETDLDLPLDRPNPFQEWGEFLALSATFYKTTGNCFWYFLRPSERENAEPLAIYCLPAHQMNIVLKKDVNMLGVESPIDYYKLIEGNIYINFDANNVIHIKNPNPNFDLNGSHLYGQSELRAALRNIQSSNDAIDNNIKTLKNGGAFGFIHSKGQNVMTPEQALQIKERLTEMDASPDRLSKIAGVSAELGFTRISLTTEELKPFDYLEYDEKQICNVLGWSTKLLNSNKDESGINNGAMIEAKKYVITDTVMPFMGMIEQALNSKFLPLFPQYQNTIIEFDPSELPEMQTDMEKLSKWLENGVKLGGLSRDEWREGMKYPKVGSPEMEAYTVDSSVMLLEDALMPLDDQLRRQETQGNDNQSV